ncbi:leucyl aminopeptidase [Chloroflexota bacterium]
MDINVIAGAIQESDTDAILISLYEDVTRLEGITKAVDKALGGAINNLIATQDFTGSLGEVAVLYTQNAIPARRVLLVGLGKQEELDNEVVRQAAAHAILQCQELNITRAATILHGVESGNLAAAEAASALVEGTLLAVYEYETKPKEQDTVTTLEIMVADKSTVTTVEAAAKDAQHLAAGVTVTRELVNAPPNICTPTYMAEIATQVAEDANLRIQVLERGQMQALGMGAMLAVAQGSDAPPRFIILEHNADRAAELDSIVLVGKGITFDTGGYSLKQPGSMTTMKTDMAGAAAVIGAMRAIGALDLPLHVVGLAPACDNMINGSAYRPQEVVTASNGTTIEIVSTDAEGRMLLADALVFAKRFEPVAAVDIATLTGACVTALGKVAAGLFCTDDDLQQALLAAAEATEERLWPLPLYDEYEELLESMVADLKHSAGTAGTGVGVSAMFLKRFVDFPAWAHIDMAGMASNAPNNKPYTPKGATGYGVRLFVEFVRQWAS